jgi:hypothetical protein
MNTDVSMLMIMMVQLMLYVEEHPAAKRASQRQQSASLRGQAKSQRRSAQPTDQIDESSQIGERDIDAPLPQPSSSGAFASRTKRQKKKSKEKDDQRGGQVLDEEDDSGSEASLDTSDGSGSIQSVNDFAGFGKGAGSVGMSSVGGW